MGRNHNHRAEGPSGCGKGRNQPKRGGPRSVGTYTLAQAAKALNIEEDDLMDHVRDGGIQMCSGSNSGKDYFLGGQIDFLKNSLRTAPLEFVPSGK